MVQYLDLVTKNGLPVSVEGAVPRYKTTAKVMEALRCLRELEEMIPERDEDKGEMLSSQGCID